MKASGSWIALLLGLLAIGTQAATLPVREHVLDNGMRLLIMEDHTAPVVMGAWVAHVGSVNERPGITGLTHLLEHMMFKGTRTIGTRDIATDLELIERQEALRDSMRALDEVYRARVRRGEASSLAEARENDPLQAGLAQRFAELVAEQRENMISNEFDQIMKKNGEIFGNAFTSEDMTAYFHVLPSNKLELWFWLESDRLGNPVFREFYSERDVVREERRSRVESTPTGAHQEAINALFWQALPYKWPVIGFASDVEQLSMPQAREYFDTWYGPGNLTAIITGDVDTDAAIALADRYFGRLRPRPDPPMMVTTEPVQLGEKRYAADVDGNTTLEVWYHTPGFGHADQPVLRVIGSLLSGTTGRLERELVQDTGIATQVSAFADAQKYAGVFYAELEAAEGHDLDELESHLFAALDKLAREPVPDQELQKVKNNWLVNDYRQRQDPIRGAFGLIQNDGLGDWRQFFEFGDALQAVSAADIQRVAAEIFRKENRMVVRWSRRESTVTAAAE
ncbi:MAG: insulinase family protein [Calditrichaeota bacterium]|nr:insulinase family protein [Candidatus Cloacimonadota bacterium]MCA9784945.1 insulinase family protein [Candidatus Cloacimonadota bacterium]MCB1045966.1 insulinase family protein [Calditrichota bacterium]MCB9473208.1 insulinase family protein [Candidatus Delongbacteria bacterium]